MIYNTLPGVLYSVCVSLTFCGCKMGRKNILQIFLRLRILFKRRPGIPGLFLFQKYIISTKKMQSGVFGRKRCRQNINFGRKKCRQTINQNNKL